jgi:glycosyltransferase involved in cell wall biosynthesis
VPPFERLTMERTHEQAIKNIHWFSNAPWAPTGYGTLTRLFAPRLRDLGYSMTIGAFYGAEGAPLSADGIPVLPASHNPYGNDVLAADAHQLEADIVITNMDAWVLLPDVTSQFKWVPWFPVDHEPVPPPLLDALKTAYEPIVYSQFGQQQMNAAGVPVSYIPGAVDTTIYKPADDRMAAREAMKFPADAFMVGIVAANKGATSRKAFDQQIRAFAAFHKRHSDAVLYLHTDMLGSIGINIGRILELSGLPKTAFRVVPSWQYARGLLTWEWMATMYSGLDVLMNATMAEGFGIPIVEAQACGTPVIVTDISSMPELVRAGWTVGYVDKFFYMDAYQCIPDMKDIEAKLELAYEKRGDLDFRQQARAGMVADYDADVVTEQYWKPVLAKIDQRLRQERNGHNERTAQRLALRVAEPSPDGKHEPVQV